MSVVFAGLALAMTGTLIAILANLHIKSKVVEMIIAGLGSAAANLLDWESSIYHSRESSHIE